MLRHERWEDEQNATRAVLTGFQSELWTALPGIIDSVDFAKNTCVVQPSIKGIFRLKDGSEQIVTMPLCLDVPLQFIGGGGFVLTFPIKKGDEGLIVFSSRCIDAWYQNGGVQPQAEIRMHDLSDGFFIPGFRSVPRAIVGIAENATVLRTEDGTNFVSVKSDQIKVVVGSNVSATFTEDQIELDAHSSAIILKDGEIDINATAVKINGITFGTHKHTGVQVGGGNSGGPIN